MTTMSRAVQSQPREAKSIQVRVEKVDTTLGLVFGFAIVCKENGRPYVDRQIDHIPEHAMLESTFGYMSGNRIAKDSHRGGAIGQVVFGFPLTTDIAKALNIQTNRTGFIIGMRPLPDILTKFATGERTGFSIGGSCEEATEVAA